MRKQIAVLLCIAMLLPGLALGEDFLVDETAATGTAATSTIQNATIANGSKAMQTAVAQLQQGSLLDALNAFAGISGEDSARQYSDYTQALLHIKRENPAAAIALLQTLSGFLDSDAQLELTKASQLHRYAQDGLFGYVDAQGAWIVAPQFDWAERVMRMESATTQANGETPYLVAMVFLGTTQVGVTDTEPLVGLFGLMRNDGTLVVPANYTDVLWTVDGVAAVTDESGVHLFDLATGLSIGDTLEEVGVYQNGYINGKQNGLWGYLNPLTGQTLGDGYVWESALPFSQGKAGVSLEGQYGFIDQTGTVVIDLQYTDVAPFSEGLAGVRVQKRWGFVDQSNTVIIKPTFASVQTFQNGLCAVKKGSAWGLVNTAGEFVLRAKYTEITDFDPIYHRAWIRQNKLWGLVSTSGSVVLKPTWSYRDDFDGNTLCVVGYKNYYGYIDASGKTRIVNAYTAASPFRADYGAVQEESGTVRYISKSQRGFALDTDVPVECLHGFIEGRKITETQTTALDTVGTTVTVVERHIAYRLFDNLGTPINVESYVGSLQE